MSPLSIVEHLVLFKVRDSTNPSNIAAMLSSLRSLSSLHLLHHLAAGPIHRHSSPSSPYFTHLLHTRFLSQPDLAAYTVHPSHLAVVRQNAPIIEDILAVDWLADLDGDRIVPPPGSPMRFLIAKPRDGTPAADVVKAVDGVSGGVNFSPGRAKGYEVCLILEMDGVEGEEELEAVENRIRGLVESLVVVDFVVPCVGL